MSGLQSAAQQLQSYGRGPDTMLAHISPDEARLIDQFQGGRRTNPMTGLPEYGALGKILKGLVRAAGAIGGFIASGGNPLGAAAGAGIATKLTGGSWKEAGVGAALGGLGAGAGNMMGGAGFMGAGNAAGVAQLSPHVASTGLAAGSTTGLGMAGGIGSTFSGIGGLGGVGAGLGGIMAAPRTPYGPPPGSGTPPVLDPGIAYNPNQLPSREYVPYEGDPATYGERGGHSFYRPRVNVNVDGVSLGDNHPMQMPEEYFSRGGRAISAAARAGRIRGPGTSTSDSIPAMLSDGEHVIDSHTVTLAGKGNNDKGQRAIENIKRKIRASAGIKSVKTAPSVRAMKRAGVR